MRYLAQMPTWSGLVPAGSGAPADVATIGSLGSIFRNIVQSIVMFAGVVLFVMLVIGGMNFLFGGGDQKKLEKAKNTISSALIGLAFLVGSYLILLLVKTVTGVDVMQFSIQTQ